MIKNKKSRQQISIGYAILAATLYAISAPFSKILLQEIPVTLLAGLLYLGAGIGMLIVSIISKSWHERVEDKCTNKEIPYIVSMIILDIAAPIFLMLGLKRTTAANASLLNNFEIVATSLIAMMLFKEIISKRLWKAISFITIASIILSFENVRSLSFSSGSLLIFMACICWGFENNCTRVLSIKNPFKIVIIKGIGSGIGSFTIAMMLKEKSDNLVFITAALILGFVAYGLSIFFYVCAQRELGAAKTSAYYAIAPFLGVILSIIIFREQLKVTFIIAFIIMIIGTYLTSTDGNVDNEKN